MKILGIETSCDETAAAVVEDGYKLLSNVVASSADLHVQYGGVVPEIAARSHIESILPVVDQALCEAFPNLRSEEHEVRGAENRTPHSALRASDAMWDQIDGIAVTYGAGLGGSLLIGVLTARTLAIAKNKPLYACNHVLGHVYANFLTGVRSEENGVRPSPSALRTSSSDLQGYHFPATQPKFPFLAIIVSGGHSQLALFRDHFDYELLGRTQDDAIGEAFDKVAKILGLPYPGGPSVSQAAKSGDPYKYPLPKARSNGARTEDRGARSHSSLRTPNSVHGLGKYDFSFSGLKTAVLRLAQAQIGEGVDFPSFKLSERLSEAQKADIAASFQRVAIETIVDKAKLAYEEFQPKAVVIAGGVAANQELRRQLTEVLPLPIEYPDLKLCTDNGAMIATLGCFHMKTGQPTADPHSLAIEPNLSM